MPNIMELLREDYRRRAAAASRGRTGDPDRLNPRPPVTSAPTPAPTPNIPGHYPGQGGAAGGPNDPGPKPKPPHPGELGSTPTTTYPEVDTSTEFEDDTGQEDPTEPLVEEPTVGEETPETPEGTGDACPEGQVWDSVKGQCVTPEGTPETPITPVTPKTTTGGGGGGRGGGTSSPAPKPPEGVLGGGKVLRIRQGNNLGGEIVSYAMVYDWPGSATGRKFYFRFNSLQQLTQVLGSNWDSQYQIVDQTEKFLQDSITGPGAWLSAGSADEIIGADRGTFSTLVQQTITEGAFQAGITDPTMLGLMYQEDEIQNILAQSIIADWTPEALRAEMRKTTWFKTVAYPGIEQFYGRTTDPEQAWKDYSRSVSDWLTVLGVDRDEDGSYRSTIGRMLGLVDDPESLAAGAKTVTGHGIDAGEFNRFAQTYEYAIENERYLPVLNEWLEEDEQAPIVDFEDWLNVLDGTSERELGDVIERADLQYAAQQQGITLDPGQLRDFTDVAALDRDASRALLRNVSDQITALGSRGLLQAGLTTDDLLYGNAGLETRGGIGAGDVQRRVAEVSREQGLSDEFGSRQTENPFRRFTQRSA